MKRRDFVIGSFPAIVAISGCLGESDDSVQDSDGDGVIDSQDYAPQDPDVQEKSDVQGGTATISPSPESTAEPTSTPTPTATATATPTEEPTPTASPTPVPESNRLQVTDDYWDSTSAIKSYSDHSVEVEVIPEYPNPDMEEVRIYAGLYEFPDGDMVSETLSDGIDRADGSQRLTIDLPEWERPDGAAGSLKQYYYSIALTPAGIPLSELEPSDVTSVMESDPWTYESGTSGPITRADFNARLDDASGTSYSRNNVEGAYELTVQGRTDGKDWEVGFFAYKSAHAATRNKSRGKGYSGYVDYELTDGTANELGDLLANDAEANGYSGRQAIEFVIDFVQALPYVPDDVSTGYDNYPKYILETIPELGGDCEDSAILLASLLEAEAFNYDMVLIAPPKHMAVGIWNKDPQGYYWEYDGRKYEYIETTGSGWGVGELPEVYQDESATVYQV